MSYEPSGRAKGALKEGYEASGVSYEASAVSYEASAVSCEASGVSYEAPQTSPPHGFGAFTSSPSPSMATR